MADDRRDGHHYTVNRPPDAIRPVVIQPVVGSALAGRISHVVPRESRLQSSTPPPATNVLGASVAAAAQSAVQPATIHVQLPGSKDVTVIPLHLPAASIASLQGASTHGTPATTYTITTGVVVPAVVPSQRQTPSPNPKVSVPAAARPGNRQRVTPPPPPVAGGTPVASGGITRTATGLVVPTDGTTVTRSCSPLTQIPQVRITPAQVQLLKKITAQVEANQGPVAVAPAGITPPRRVVTGQVSQTTTDQRPKSMPAAFSGGDTRVVVSSSLPQAKQAISLCRLPVNTEPQRFFASNTLTVPNSGGSWRSDRPPRPSSHPNLPLADSKPGSTQEATAQSVVSNGLDVTNGHTHQGAPPGGGANYPYHSSSIGCHNNPQKQSQPQQKAQQPPLLTNCQTHVVNKTTVPTHKNDLSGHRPLGKCHSDVAGTLLNHRSDSRSDQDGCMPRLLPERTVDPVHSSSRLKLKQEEPLRERLISPFNMRVHNLNNFPSAQSSYRATYRSQAFAIHRAKTGSITSTAKSLDLLRQNLQKHINQEIDVIIQRYMMYFKPGIENIKTNNGDSTVTSEHVTAVCRQILEEAKKMYTDGTGGGVAAGSVLSSSVSAGGDGRRDPSRSHTSSSSSSSSLRENQDVRAKKMNLFNIPKRHGPSDSEPSVPRKKKKGRPPLYISGRSTPSKTGKLQDTIKRVGPKWDPERLTEESRFIMGAKANKALGLGNTRGRLYIKHPSLFKYSGDQDDKQWLFEHQHMPATGGKAYMLLEEDIRELAMTDEYRDNPGLLPDEMQGFTVPSWLVEKMRKQMQAMRSDTPKSSKQRSRSSTPNAAPQEPATVEVDHTLPFTCMSNQTKTSITVSPSNSETLEQLTCQTDDADLPDGGSFTMSTSLVGLSPGPSVSPAPSDLDGFDDEVTTPFGTAD